MKPEYQFLTTLPSICILALIGMLMHFFKKVIKGETVTEIRCYFADHFKSTVIAIVSTLVSAVGYYMTLSTNTPADILAAFGIGYTCDSLFNKWDKAA